MTVRELLAAHPCGERIAAVFGHLQRALPASAGLHVRSGEPTRAHPAAISRRERPSHPGGPSRRGRLYGRLAAMFFVGSGLLGLITLPLPAPGSNTAAMAVIDAAALVLGAAIWLAPWDTWPRRAILSIVPPALTLIALGNAFGGTDRHTYGVFFVVAFVWIGMAQPPCTSVAMAPLAAAAYIVPLFFLPGSRWAGGLSSAAVTIPLCVLVGEGIAWGVGKLERIELALLRERGQAEQLRRLDEMKDTFLSAVSHELRTPITICRGHLEVLEEGAGDQEVRAVKETLIDELDFMGRLVEDLTTLARVDDRALMRFESLPMERFLNSLTTKAEAILGDRLRVESGVCDGTLHADPQRLTQAILNLVRNAAEHAAGGEPVCLRVKAETSSWRFEVADRGGGLPPGHEQHVFEPFRTGSPTTGGTGLGLAIVRGIAKAHGGESGVVNRPGQGATFWVRIER